MPLHTETLITSDFASIMSGEAFKAALLLWCHSWHQVPAASLPNDDRVLARLSGAGSRWRELKKEALYGFVLCSDGRLYHPLIAELAVTAWTSSDHQRRRSVTGWKKHMAHAPASKIDAKEVKGKELKKNREQSPPATVPGDSTSAPPASNGGSLSVGREKPNSLPDSAAIPSDVVRRVKAARPELQPDTVRTSWLKFKAENRGKQRTRQQWNASFEKWLLNERPPPGNGAKTGSSEWWKSEAATTAKAAELGMFSACRRILRSITRPHPSGHWREALNTSLQKD